MTSSVRYQQVRMILDAAIVLQLRQSQRNQVLLALLQRPLTSRPEADRRGLDAMAAR